tara:strand:+ start:1536 stop:1676 length:141 start_codon:yes stop_codon:yes gene_type:complete
MRSVIMNFMRVGLMAVIVMTRDSLVVPMVGRDIFRGMSGVILGRHG